MKRMISLLLSICMIVCWLPSSAFAETADRSISLFSTEGWTGSGTSTAPYVLDDEADLQALSTAVSAGSSYADIYFKLGADITLSETWVPIGTTDCYFRGVFDGASYTVSGMTAAGDYMAFFGYVGSGATIKNLNLSDYSLDGEQYVAGIAAYVHADTTASVTISNCTVNGTLDSNDGDDGGQYCAGIAAYANGELGAINISDCTTGGQVNGDDYMGGIVGYGTGSLSITRCTNSAPINGGRNCYSNGGIIGYANGSDSNRIQITKCMNTRGVSGNAYSEDNGSSYLGGICGSANYVDLYGCANHGSVSTFFAGGIVANPTSCSFYYCLNTGNLSYSSDSYGYGIGKTSTTNTYTSCYCISGEGAVGAATAVTADELSSGYVAWTMRNYMGQDLETQTVPMVSDTNKVYRVLVSGDVSDTFYVNGGKTTDLPVSGTCMSYTTSSGTSFDENTVVNADWTLTATGPNHDYVDGICSKCEAVDPDAVVAQIGDVDYLTLGAAVSAAADGDTITLVRSIADAPSADALLLNKNLTIDLGGFSLWSDADLTTYCADGYSVLDNGDGTYTVFNGSYGVCGEYLTWVLDRNTGVLTISGTGAMTDYTSSAQAPWSDNRTTIQQVVLESGVTTVGNWAFNECNNLTSVTLPQGLISIGEYAFELCSLTEIALPEGLTTIGNCAFASCTSLENIALPSTLTTLGSVAFLDCAFSSISIPSGVTVIEEGTFNGSALTSITLHDNITSIGDSAFYGTSLTTITLPANLVNIGIGAFASTPLETVIIPAGVISIEESTFCGCTALTSITLPSGVTSIGVSAFSGCSALTDVYFLGTQDQWNAVTIGEDNTALTSATIHAGTACELWGHTVVTDAAVAVTCTASGLTEGSHCDVCSEVLVAQEVIPATGHTWVAADCVTPMTCTVCGATEGGTSSATRHGNLKRLTSNGNGWLLIDGATTTSGKLPAGNYYLGENITVNTTIQITGAVKICLNGKVLQYSSSTDGSVFYISNSGSLSIYDCGTTTHWFTKDESGLWVWDEADGTKYVNGGVITGGTGYSSGNYGGAVYVWSGTFALHAGNLVGNSAAYGGAIAGDSYGAQNIRIYGGRIVGNGAVDKSSSDGGAIYTSGYFSNGIYQKYTDLTITGGLIDQNFSDDGGAIAGGGTITISGGTIRENYAEWWGGALYTGGPLTITGGTITDNTAGQRASGIHLSGSLSISGSPYIYGNTTTSGQESNLYLNSSTTIISVTAPLSSNACIGIDKYVPTNHVFTSGGGAAYQSCFISDNTGYHIIPSDGELLFESHDYSVASDQLVSSATCTSAPTYLAQCSGCDVVSSSVTITVGTASGHAPEDAVIENEIAADCITAGSYDTVVYCSVCGTEVSRETVTVPAVGHTVVTDPAVAPTCSTTGLTEGSHCSICGTVFTVQETVDMLEHAWGEPDASLTKTCSLCGATEQVDIVSGTTADGLSWTLTSAGHLTVSGTGACTDGSAWSNYTASILTLTLESGITGLDDTVIADLTALTTLNLNDTVTELGPVVLNENCTNLRVITVASGNTAYTAVDSVLFNKAQTELLVYPSGNTRSSYTVPDGVEIISEQAFFRAKNLTALSLPISLTEVEDTAFYKCSSLSTVTYPGTEGYWNTVAIGDDNDELLDADFTFGTIDTTSGTCGTNLTWVLEMSTGKLTITGTGAMTSAPWNKAAVQSVTIGSGVTSICDRAFYACTNLSAISIADTVTSIGDSAFCKCSSLEMVTIPDSVTYIEQDAFFRSGLETVVVPDSVTFLGESAFDYCTNLTQAVIGSGVTTIIDNTFENCSSLTTVTIPKSVTSIGDDAFYNCPLETVYYTGSEPQWGLVSIANGNISLLTAEHIYASYLLVEWNSGHTVLSISGMVDGSAYVTAAFYDANGQMQLVKHYTADQVKSGVGISDSTVDLAQCTATVMVLDEKYAPVGVPYTPDVPEYLYETLWLFATEHAYIDGSQKASAGTLLFSDGTITHEVDTSLCKLGIWDLGQRYVLVIDGATNNVIAVQSSADSSSDECRLIDVNAEINYSTSGNAVNNKYSFTFGSLEGIFTDDEIPCLTLDATSSGVPTTIAASDMYKLAGTYSADDYRAIDRNNDGEIDYLLVRPYTYGYVTRVGTSRFYGDYMELSAPDGSDILFNGNSKWYIEDCTDLEELPEEASILKMAWSLEDDIYEVEILEPVTATFDKYSTKGLYTFDGESYYPAASGWALPTASSVGNELTIITDDDLLLYAASIPATLDDINAQLCVVLDSTDHYYTGWDKVKAIEILTIDGEQIQYVLADQSLDITSINVVDTHGCADSFMNYLYTFSVNSDDEIILSSLAATAEGLQVLDANADVIDSYWVSDIDTWEVSTNFQNDRIAADSPFFVGMTADSGEFSIAVMTLEELEGFTARNLHVEGLYSSGTYYNTLVAGYLAAEWLETPTTVTGYLYLNEEIYYDKADQKNMAEVIFSDGTAETIIIANEDVEALDMYVLYTYTYSKLDDTYTLTAVATNEKTVEIATTDLNVLTSFDATTKAGTATELVEGFNGDEIYIKAPDSTTVQRYDLTDCILAVKNITLEPTTESDAINVTYETLFVTLDELKEMEAIFNEFDSGDAVYYSDFTYVAADLLYVEVYCVTAECQEILDAQ